MNGSLSSFVSKAAATAPVTLAQGVPSRSPYIVAMTVMTCSFTVETVLFFATTVSHSIESR